MLSFLGFETSFTVRFLSKAQISWARSPWKPSARLVLVKKSRSES